MKRGVAIAALLTMCVPAWAEVLLLEPGYRADIYTSYPVESVGRPNCATFDSHGNLYVTHLGTSRDFQDGTVCQVEADGTASVLAAGFYYPRDIVCTGGTAYGNALYVADVGKAPGGEIARISPSGEWHSFAVPKNQPGSIALDRTGNYSGLLYTGTLGQDHIDAIGVDGLLSQFSAFPYNSSGGPYAIAFDLTGDYGGLMFVATTCTGAPEWSGLFTLNTSGEPTRFTDDLVAATFIAFDTTGLLGADMFAVAKEDFSDPWYLWRIGPDGNAFRFAQTTISDPMGLTFGPDGALYVIEYTDQTATINRIVPEPATILLFALAAVALRKKP